MVLRFRSLIFQSLGSVGPALNFVAVLPIMSIFSGSALPLATSIAFFISFVTFIPVLIFSASSREGTGYVAYVAESCGRKMQLYTGFVYIFYSSIVMPSILMFASFFVISYYFSTQVTAYEFIFSLLMLFFLLSLIRGKRRFTQHFITSFGIVEFACVIILSIIFIKIGNLSFLKITGNTILTSNFWEAVILGILMFSGSGSSIFLSRKWEGKLINFRSTLIISYMIIGMLMVSSSVAVVVFMGKSLDAYGSNPVIMLKMSGKYISAIAPPLIIGLLIVSGFNLMLSYSNALLNMLENFQSEYISLAPRIKKAIFPYLLALSWIVVLSIFTLSTGYYTGFIILVEVVSLCYIIVHALTGLSLFRSHKRKMSYRIIGLISIVLLGIALLGSIENSSSVFPVTIAIFLSILGVSSILVLFVKRFTHRVYH